MIGKFRAAKIRTRTLLGISLRKTLGLGLAYVARFPDTILFRLQVEPVRLKLMRSPERNRINVFCFKVLLFLVFLCAVVYLLLGMSQWYWLRSAIDDGVLLTGERLGERAHHANRSDEMRSFRQEILRGSEKSYTVVIGPHGCGKSSLIQDVLQDSAEGGAKGVVYVRHPDATKKTSLFNTLREAFGGLYIYHQNTCFLSISFLRWFLLLGCLISTGRLHTRLKIR